MFWTLGALEPFFCSGTSAGISQDLVGFSTYQTILDSAGFLHMLSDSSCFGFFGFHCFPRDIVRVNYTKSS